MNLDEVRRKRIREFNEQFTNFILDLTGGAPNALRDSYTIKALEAKDVVNNSIITAEAVGLGMDEQSLSDLINAKDALYRPAVGAATAKLKLATLQCLASDDPMSIELDL